MDTEFGKVRHRLLRVTQRVHHWVPRLRLGESGIWAQSLMFIGTFVNWEIILLVDYWRVLILTNRILPPHFMTEFDTTEDPDISEAMHLMYGPILEQCASYHGDAYHG